jgi:OST-HTH/LOTUS domain
MTDSPAEQLLLRDEILQRKTPKPFVAACDKFIYIENLTFDNSDDDENDAAPAPGASVRPARRKPATAAELKNDVSLVTFLRNALEAASDDDGWAPLAGVGNMITNQRPDFDPRSYGYRKLSDLITATTLFETDRRSPGDGKQPIIYARLKRRRSPARRATAAAAAAKA